MPVMNVIRDVAVNVFRAAHHVPLTFRRPGRILILDPFLTNSLSHNLNFDVGFRDALERIGWSVRILANRYADDMVASQRKTYRFFSSDAYGGFSPYVDSFWRRNANFYRDLSLLNFSNFDVDNVLLLHTVTVFELFGLARWYQELPAIGRPRLIIYIQMGPEFGVTNAEEVRLVHTSYRVAAHNLAKFPGVLICASSQGLLNLFNEEEVSKQLFPLPICWPSTQRVRPKNGRVVFGYFGGARKVKGFHLIVDAISAVLDALPNADFVINSPYNPEFCNDFSNLREMGNRVQVREMPAGERAAYYSQFDDVDVILNAYDPTQYRDATSMICLESIGMGKGIIAMDGTWSNEAACQLGAAVVTMKEFSSQSLAHVIATYTNNEKTVSLKAKIAQGRVRETHNVGAFLDAAGIKAI